MQSSTPLLLLGSATALQVPSRLSPPTAAARVAAPVLIEESFKDRYDRAAAQMRGKEVSTGIVGGAVLGGLLAGPFGAMWGSQIGASVGAAKSEARYQKEVLERAGLGEEVRASLASIAADLAEMEEALARTRDAEASQLRLQAGFEGAVAEKYAEAEQLLRGGSEDAARAALHARQELQAKARVAALEAEEARLRVASCEASVQQLQLRAKKVEAIVSRSMRAAGMAADPGPADDPLLEKFRRLSD